jgi:hypothetical protein
MILLNWLLGLGALAFTVPLAIHLLFRNRFEMVDWGAMQFLQSVVRQNRRRMQLRNLLLLLVRCAIPVLLALCLARPVLTGWQQPRGDSPVSMVVVIDNSYSMAARTPEGTSRLNAATEATRRITETLGRGSEITLLASDGAVVLTDPQSVGTKLNELAVGGSPLDLDSLLSRAMRISADSSLANRQIVLITDHSARDFSQSMLDGLPSIADRLKAITPTPDLAWVNPLPDADGDASPTNFHNLRIHRVEPATTVAVPGQTVPWFIETRIDGPRPGHVDLVVRIDGEIKTRQPIAVQGNSAATIMQLAIPEIGQHVVEIAVAASSDHDSTLSRDDFPPDDRVWRDFAVIDPISVWLVDGSPSERPLASDTDFLGYALSPFSLGRQPGAAAGTTSADLFRTRKVRTGRLNEEPPSENDPAMIVLADVARPTPADSKWLVDYVQNRGGTLVVFGGPSIDPAWYDEQLVGPDTRPILPMAYGDSRQLSSGLAIDDTRLTYPPLVAFADQEKGTLSGATVTGYRELNQRQGATSEPQILLRLEGGQPLAVIGGAGGGQVLQFATTSNERWTTLPLRPVFVPLMQRLFAHLAVGRRGNANPVAGEPITITGVLPDSRWTVTTPDGQTQILVAGNVPDASIPNASARAAAGEPLVAPSTTLALPVAKTAGAYRFETDGKVTWAGVNVPDVDLKPEAVDPQLHQQAAERLGATFHRSTDAFLADDANRRFGRGIWRLVLVALLAAMILEPVIQQRRAKPMVAR